MTLESGRRPDLPPDPSGVRRRPVLALATASYRTMRRDLGVGVAISVGLPHWPLPYDLVKCADLAPWGLLRKPRLSPIEFDALYADRLNRFGHEAILRLEEITDAHPGQRLVLLCWEAPGERCHRHQAAEWLSRHLRVEIPEIGANVGTLEPAHNSNTATTGHLSGGQLGLDLDRGVG